MIQSITFSSAAEHKCFPRKQKCGWSLFFPIFRIIGVRHLLRTMKDLRFCSTCKLRSFSVTVSWKLAEDTKLLGQRQ